MPTPPRLILHNAQIYTLSTNQTTADALVIEQGKILATGSEAEILREFSHLGELQDMYGQTILPGLTDAHLHLESYALGLQALDCETTTRAECLQRVVERGQIIPPGGWILGHGWNQNNWPEGFGTAGMLDQIAPHNPVFLTSKSLHSAWANSAAMHLAGINAQTPDPAGGRLRRDEHGNPDGILFESAMWVVNQVVPEPGTERILQAIHLAQTILWSMGLTGVHDFDRSRCFTALQMLKERGDLGLRVVKSIPLEDLPYAVGLGLRSGFGDNTLRIGSVKIFADGALGPQTAAMLAPYEGEADNRGMLLLDGEELYEHGRLAVDNGFSLAVHAIGDRANHEVLDALQHLREYERHVVTPAQRVTGVLRHRIEHAQLLHPDDAGRLASLGIVASMQPIHAPSDMLMADRYWGKRAALSYAWREQLKHGSTLAFGSDAPVESPNPFWGLHAAVTRRRADGSPGIEGWYPEQRLNLLDALHGFTSGPAYAANMEHSLGKLAPGFLADLIMLKVDPFACTPDELHDLRPCATMIGGQWVWQE